MPVNVASWILGHLVAGALALAVLAGLGAPLERWLLGAAPPRGRPERVAIAIAFGSALAMAILFALASTGTLRPLPIATLAALGLASGAAMLLRRSPPAAVPARGNTRGNNGHALPIPAAILLWAGLLAVGAALLLHALRPDVATDADVYHLTLPRIFLEHGGFAEVPFSVYSHWPLGVELLYAAVLAHSDWIAATTLHFVFGVLAAVLAGALAGPGLGAATAALFLIHPVVLLELRVAYVDLAGAFLLAACAVLFEHAHHRAARSLEDDSASARLLLAAGICAAAALSVKLNGFIGPLCCALVFLVARWRRSRDLAATARQLVLFAAPMVAFGVAWAAKTWVATGNPVYPFLYQRFGGPSWSAALGEQWTAWQRGIGMGRAPLDWLLLPWRVLTQGDFGYAHFDGRLHPLWLAALPAALWHARRDPRSARLLAISGLYFVVWAAGSQQMRFLIPILPLLAAAAARALGAALAPLATRVRFLVAAVLAVALVAALVDASRVYWEQTPRLLASYERDGDSLRERAVHPAYRFINDLPASARLLMLNTNRGFFVRRPYVADSFFEASQIADHFGAASSPSEGRALLRELGISHVLVERADRGARYPEALAALLQDQSKARVVYTSPDERFVVLELAP